MATRKERILTYLTDQPGSTDSEITDHLEGKSEPPAPQQAVNQACRQLEETGVLERCKRDDGKLGNYLTGKPDAAHRTRRIQNSGIAPDKGRNKLQEDEVKKCLEAWLHDQGWQTKIDWGRTRGVDITATKRRKRWLIEVKGCGSGSAMRVNYFIGVLGEVLQRMDDPEARYSIAIPDMAQFRGLWERLPALAKKRTGISALFVDVDDVVREEQ